MIVLSKKPEALRNDGETWGDNRLSNDYVKP